MPAIFTKYNNILMAVLIGRIDYYVGVFRIIIFFHLLELLADS